jgi:hypothetical protein
VGYIGILGNVCVCPYVCVCLCACVHGRVRARASECVCPQLSDTNVPTQSQVVLINNLICLTLQLYSPYIMIGLCQLSANIAYLVRQKSYQIKKYFITFILSNILQHYVDIIFYLSGRNNWSFRRLIRNTPYYTVYLK